MNKLMILIIFLVPVVCLSQNKIKIENFKKQSKISKMECFKIVDPKSSKDFMDHKVSSLGSIGFKPRSTELQSDTEICVKETDRRFAYYKKGYFRYVDRDVAPFKDDIPVDTLKMRKIATEIQKSLTDANKAYLLISKNETYIMRAPSLTEKLAYVSYRFVRVFNDRLVLGLTDEIEITLGEEGMLEEFRSYEPEYEPYVSNTRAVVKPGAYDKILKIKHNMGSSDKKDDGMYLDYDEMDIDGVTDAYYAIKDAGQNVIVPHVAVLMSCMKEEKKMAKEEFLSLRAEDWSNLNENDIDVINATLK